MADDTSRKEALELTLAVVSLCRDTFDECDVVDVTNDVLIAADLVWAWLNPPMPDPVAKLVMNVGPVTEQSS